MTGHGVLTITPRQARDAGSCTESYRTGMNALRRTGRARLDTEVPIVEVLDVLGFGDALWAMGAIEATLTLRLFAADCAEHVLQLFEAAYPDDRRPREAIRVARLHVHGLASEHERDAAQAAAWAAARAAAGGAAWDAACDAAQAAAWAAAGGAAWDAACDAAQAAAQAAAGGAAQAAAWAAAWDAARDWQESRLRDYLEGRA